MLAQVFRNMNGWLVSVYKFFGFGILIALVVGMTSYLVVNAFFLFNHDWIVPVILSPRNERVMQVNLQYMEHVYQADKLRTERESIEAQLGHIRHALALHEQFQANFIKALAADLRQKQNERRALAKLAEEYQKRATSLAENQNDLQATAAQKLEEQYKSSLINQDDYVKGKHLYGQLALSTVVQQEKMFELKDRKDRLAQEIAAQGASARVMERLATAADDANNPYAAGRDAVSVDVLMKEQQFLQSEIAKSELRSKVAPLEMQRQKIEDMLANYDKVVANLKESPYLRATQQNVTLAFVTYDNLPGVKTGSKVFGCYMSFVFCREAGRVAKVIDGEVVAKHPMTNREVRGVMVEVDLNGSRWAEERALMVNGKPFLL